MPSRAVLRKKVRRESARLKCEADPLLLSRRDEPARLDGEPSKIAPSTTSSVPFVNVAKVKRVRAVDSTDVPTQSRNSLNEKRSMGSVAELNGPIVDKRQRVEVPSSLRTFAHDTETKIVDNVSDPISEASLTRKERKKLEAQRKLEKQISRLNSRRPKDTVVDVDENAKDENEADEGGVSSETNALRPVLRHDPRFTNGTFWQKRKEQRSRTIFVGNLPLLYTSRDVEDLITSAVDSSGGLTDEESTAASAAYSGLASPGGDIVHSVDALKVAPGARIRHMYVVISSKLLAARVASILDGMEVMRQRLRCNLSADKQQRAEAIRRRAPN